MRLLVFVSLLVLNSPAWANLCPQLFVLGKSVQIRAPNVTASPTSMNNGAPQVKAPMPTRAVDAGNSMVSDKGILSEADLQEAIRKLPRLAEANDQAKELLKSRKITPAQANDYLQSLAASSVNIGVEVAGKNLELCDQFPQKEIQGFLGIFRGIGDPALKSKEQVCGRMLGQVQKSFADTLVQAKWRLRALAGLLPGAPCELINPAVVHSCTRGAVRPQ